MARKCAAIVSDPFTEIARPAHPSNAIGGKSADGGEVIVNDGTVANGNVA